MNSGTQVIKEEPSTGDKPAPVEQKPQLELLSNKEVTFTPHTSYLTQFLDIQNFGI